MIWIAFLAFALTIPAANWTFANFGAMPVGFGLEAPVAVLWAGAALALRDVLHEQAGKRWVLAAVAVGAALSVWLASPALAVASGAAFVASELADLAVYAPLRRRSVPLAVLLSGTIGAAVDTVLFLGLAFGSLAYAPGMMLAKLYVAALAAGLAVILRSRPRSAERTAL